MPRSLYLVISCEHGGNRVPARYRSLFHNSQRTLETHQGYDIGALDLARYLAKKLGSTLVTSTVTRLLVDLNRSLHHRALFSPQIKKLDEKFRQHIVVRYYLPYRMRIEQLIQEAIDSNHNVIHLSVHSFTPSWHGRPRNTDIGLLYDPARPFERQICTEISRNIHRRDSTLRVRRNYPYRGTADGLTTALRKKFSANRYAGIELEINQRYAKESGPSWTKLQSSLARAFDRLMMES